MGQICVNVLFCCSTEVNMHVANPSASALRFPALLCLHLLRASKYPTETLSKLYTTLTLHISSLNAYVALSD